MQYAFGMGFLRRLRAALLPPPRPRRPDEIDPVAAERQAREDVAGGFLRLRQAGRPSEWTSQYNHLLKARYGITVRRVSGCLTTSAESAARTAYNTVMHAEIARRFGATVLGDVAREAERNWRAAQAKNPPEP